MRTVDEITIKAEPDAVLCAAAEVENWPKILPHYRWVKVLKRQGDALEVEMAAKRGWIPVKWAAIQMVNNSNRRIYYKHIEGATRGMQVEWSIEPGESDVNVKIIHDLYLKQPVVKSWIGRWIVANFFIKHIAGKTLSHMKTYLESGGSGE